jgi:ketosteroid isomerase-like protein
VSANLDLVRSIYDAWGRGGFSSAERAAPQIQYINTGVHDQAWLGRDGMLEGFRDWIRVWSDWTVIAEQYLEPDANRVLVRFESSRPMRASGPEAERLSLRGATLFDVRDDMVTRIVQYADRDRAFADLGLCGGVP